MRRHFRVALTLCALVLCASAVTSASSPDIARVLLGVASFQAASARTVEIGALPKNAIRGFPLPELKILGGVTANYGYKGDVTDEVLYYDAPGVARRQFMRYAAALRSAGWKDESSPSPIAALGGYVQFCRAAGPSIDIRAEPHYLVVNAGTMPCVAVDSAIANAVKVPARIPYPEFWPSSDVTFGRANSTASETGPQMVTIAIVSERSAATILAELSLQMTDAGWAEAKPDQDADTAVFTIRDKSGEKWIAGSSIVMVGKDSYIFTLSGFKASELDPAKE